MPHRPPMDRWDNPKWTEDLDGKLKHEWSPLKLLIKHSPYVVHIDQLPNSELSLYL